MFFPKNVLWVKGKTSYMYGQEFTVSIDEVLTLQPKYKWYLLIQLQ